MAAIANPRDIYLQSQTRLLSVTIPSQYDFTGTINSVPAATVTTQANNGNTAYTGTTQYRTDSPPTNAPYGGSAPVIATNDDGSRDITLAWTYTQGAIPADGFILFYKQGTSAIVTTDPAYSLPNTSRSYRFQGVHQGTAYRAGIAAFRRTETGIQITGIYNPTSAPDWRVAAGTTNITSQINGVAAATLTTQASGGYNIQQKLEVSGTTVLKGVVVPTDSGALKTGTITWNATTGALTGGSGCAMTEWGIIGAKSGVASFTLESATGNAVLAGDLITAGDVYATGKNLSADTVYVGSTSYNLDYSIFGRASSNATNSSTVRAGIFGRATAATAQANVGVVGYGGNNGSNLTSGVGVYGFGAYLGGYFVSAGLNTFGLKAQNTNSSTEVRLAGSTNAIEIVGKMTIDNSTLVTNLNTQKWNGMTTDGTPSVGGGNALTANLVAKKPGTHTELEWVKVTLSNGREGDIAWWPRA